VGERSGVYSVLVGKTEGKRSLGRPRCRWVDKIRMDLQEVGCGYVDWIGLAQDTGRWRTVVSAVMNLRVPSTIRLAGLEVVTIQNSVFRDVEF
jgi:hypothetical protein